MAPQRWSPRTVLEVATASLREGHDLREILREVTAAGVEATGAEYGAFFYHDEDEQGARLDLFTLVGADPAEFPATTPVRHTALFGPTFAGRESVRIADVARDPRYGRGQHGGVPPAHPPVRSYLATPVLATDGRVVGALLYAHGQPGRFGPQEQAAAEAVAAEAGVAVDNALLLATERTAREAAERERALARAATERLRKLQRITALLSGTVSAADVVDVVPEAVREVLGCPSASLFVLDPTGARLVGRGSADLPVAVAGLLPGQALDADTPSVEAFRTRRPVQLLRRDLGRYAGLRDRDPGELRAMVAVPVLDSGGRAVGVLVVHSLREEEAAPEDVALHEGIAAQVAQALERARLYDAERATREQLAASVAALTDLARDLQHGLLPRTLPELERAQVAVRYLPAVVGAEVGGDWYDVIATRDHAVFVIGDVQGHSTAAAALMGQLRTAVRAYVSEGHGPAAVLGRTNRMLLDLGHELFATCCLVQLDQRTGVVVVASAGHPVPVVADERGVRALAASPGPPLGVVEEVRYEIAVHELALPGRMVLVTDGVVESATADLSVGEGALRRALTRPAADCEAAADLVVAGIPHRLTDDAAVLLVDYAGPQSRGREVVVTLPTDVGAVVAARRLLREELAQWQLAPLVPDSELVLSELVTNALVHTDGPPVLTLRYVSEDGELTVAVRDRSVRRLPVDRLAGPDAQSGRGLFIVDALSSAWGAVPHEDGKTVWATLALGRA